MKIFQLSLKRSQENVIDCKDTMEFPASPLSDQSAKF